MLRVVVYIALYHCSFTTGPMGGPIQCCLIYLRAFVRIAAKRLEPYTTKLPVDMKSGKGELSRATRFPLFAYLDKGCWPFAFLPTLCPFLYRWT